MNKKEKPQEFEQ